MPVTFLRRLYLLRPEHYRECTADLIVMEKIYTIFKTRCFLISIFF